MLSLQPTAAPAGWHRSCALGHGSNSHRRYAGLAGKDEGDRCRVPADKDERSRNLLREWFRARYHPCIVEVEQPHTGHRACHGKNCGIGELQERRDEERG